MRRRSRRWWQRAVLEFGHIDIVLCAAGVSYANYGLTRGEQYEFQPFTDKSLAEWHKVLSINLDGVFLTCRAAAREMINERRGGRIINISSIAAFSSLVFLNTRSARLGC